MFIPFQLLLSSPEPLIPLTSDYHPDMKRLRVDGVVWMLQRSGGHTYLSCQWRDSHWSERPLERRRLGQDFRPYGEGTGVQRQDISHTVKLHTARQCFCFNTQHELAF